MKNSAVSFLLFLFLTTSSLFAQTEAGKDKIILLNGNIKKCYVQSYDNSTVTFKMREDDQVQIISADKIFMILDENNDELFFYGCSDNSTGNSNEGGGNNESKSKECEKNNTGSFTITNKTKETVNMNVTGLKYFGETNPGGPVIPNGGTTNYSISPGETITLSNVIAGSYKYSASTISKFVSSGEFNIQKCKTNHKDIQ